MTGTTIESERRRRVLFDLLAEYLQMAGRPGWPGADGMTVEAVLFAYPSAAAAGQVPSREQLLRAHADLAAELEEFFGP
jgi:hypothetical protein